MLCIGFGQSIKSPLCPSGRPCVLHFLSYFLSTYPFSFPSSFLFLFLLFFSSLSPFPFSFRFPVPFSFSFPFSFSLPSSFPFPFPYLILLSLSLSHFSSPFPSPFPGCHGNEIWDKIGYNLTCVRDFCEIFAPIWGFSGMADRPRLPWQRNLGQNGLTRLV